MFLWLSFIIRIEFKILSKVCMALEWIRLQPPLSSSLPVLPAALQPVEYVQAQSNWCLHGCKHSSQRASGSFLSSFRSLWMRPLRGTFPNILYKTATLHTYILLVLCFVFLLYNLLLDLCCLFVDWLPLLEDVRYVKSGTTTCSIFHYVSRTYKSIWRFSGTW